MIIACVYLGFSGIISNGIAEKTYKVKLETGSEVFEVKFFDPDLWESVISANHSPSDWYGGYSNIVGAQSKFTDLSKINFDDISSQTFQCLYYRWFNIPYNEILEPNGYDYGYIDSNYPNEYSITYVYKQYWTFQNQPFNQFPHDNQKEFVVFLNVSEINENLMDYNHFASIINNDTRIQSLNFSLPIINSDEFVWQYFSDFNVVPTPVSNYLQELINSLACENITVDKQKLTFYRKGNEPYIATYFFNDYGKVEKVIIQNTLDDLLFKIVSFYPKYSFLVIIGISIAGLVSVIIIFIYRRKKVRKLKLLK